MVDLPKNQRVKGFGRFRIRFPNNLPAHQRWMTYLASEKFDKTVSKHISSGEARKLFESEARKVIQEEIYDKWPDPGTRTNRLLKSFRVAFHESNLGFSVYSDYQNSGPSIKSGLHEGSGSYGVFFEMPDAFESFIPPEDTGRRRERPFMEPLTRAIHAIGLHRTDMAYEKAIRLRMPKQT